MTALLLSACVVWPLVLAAGLAFGATRPAARVLAPWAALPALWVGLHGAGEHEFGWILLGGRIGLDGIAGTLLPAIGGLWLVAGVVAQRYLGAGPRRDRFFGWFLAAMAGNLLLLAALDVVVFYLGFALMSFASYGLVVHEGSARARHAGRYYIVLVVLGEVCIFSALMLLASRAPIDFASLRASFLADGSGRNDLVIGLLGVGFGIKAGVLGLHFWLPLAHPVAPAPASAVLSGAMIKAGLLAWMRLLPLGDMALPAWGTVFATLGLATAVYGVLAGLPQREPKTVLAYSSVSQMGVMTLAIGLALLYPAQWPLLLATLLVYMVHHSLVKGGLFLGAGLAQHALRPAAQRLVVAALVLGALAMAGVPMSGGLVAKQGLKSAVATAAGPWHDAVPWLLSLSSMLTALLMLRFLQVARPASDERAEPLPASVWIPWILLVAASWVAPWLVATPALRSEALTGHAAAATAGPLLAAVAIGLLAWRLYRAGYGRAWPTVPPGDLGIPLERLAAGVVRVAAAWARTGLPAALSGLRSLPGRLARSGPEWAHRLEHGEAHVANWAVTGTMVLLLAAVFAWLMA